MSVQYVEYLASSGTQYIDTGIVADQNTGLRLDFEFRGARYIAGARQTASDRAFVVTGVSGPRLSIDFGSVRTQIAATVGTRHVVEIKAGTVYCDGVLLAHPGGSFRTPGPMLLFGVYRGNTTPPEDIAEGKIYRATFFKNGIMTANYVPAMDENGVACMYETVSKACVYNAGAGTFTAGPVVPRPSLDRKAFLSGLAVGRQLKGWATAPGADFKHFYISDGSEIRINNQGADEYNTLVCEAGVRFALFQPVPNDSNMAMFAASLQPFSGVTYSYRSDGTRVMELLYGRGNTPLLFSGKTYYYGYANWRDPVPQQELPCDVPPVMRPGTTALSEDEILCNGILMTFGGGRQRAL